VVLRVINARLTQPAAASAATVRQFGQALHLGSLEKLGELRFAARLTWETRACGHSMSEPFALMGLAAEHQDFGLSPQVLETAGFAKRMSTRLRGFSGFFRSLVPGGQIFHGARLPPGHLKRLRLSR